MIQNGRAPRGIPDYNNNPIQHNKICEHIVITTLIAYLYIPKRVPCPRLMIQTSFSLSGVSKNPPSIPFEIGIQLRAQDKVHCPVPQWAK